MNQEEQRRTFKYKLRCTVQPGHREDEKLEQLLRFCIEASVDDVMFILNGEELNRGHLTLEEAQPWIDLVAKAKPQLSRIGVSTSINPWTTLLGADRGRKLRSSQNFRLMTDPSGRQASAQVCPLCDEFRAYLGSMYSAYAEVEPDVLWVEDDLRLHNHAPLDWGGCFCEAHLAEYAKRAGVKSFTREEFVRGLLAPGDPHDYRRVWLDTSRETWVGLSALIAEAVHRVSPMTRIGFMTSCPDVHAAEGRDWHGIFAAADGGRTAEIRPHLPSYTEDCGYKHAWRFNAYSRATAAFIPERTQIYPELENYPYTYYSKSRTFQRFQTEMSLLLGSSGITMNILDMSGNSLYPIEDPERWMRETKPFLNAGAALGLHSQHMRGVQIVMFERSSYTLHTLKGERMEELYPNEMFWASVLSDYGIANRYVTEGDLDDSPIAVSGQVLRNLDHTAIHTLLTRSIVLLDGEAVETLYDMGYGYLIGVNGVSWHESESGFQSYEEIVDGRKYAGLVSARINVQIFTGQHAEIVYDRPIHTISAVFNGDGERVSNGMTVVNGNVFILPYGRFGDGCAGNQALPNPVRKEVIQHVLMQGGGSVPAMVTSHSPHVSIHVFNISDHCPVLAIANTSLDDLERWELYLSDEAAVSGTWTVLSRDYPNGAPVKVEQEGSLFRCSLRLNALSVTLLVKETD